MSKSRAALFVRAAEGSPGVPEVTAITDNLSNAIDGGAGLDLGESYAIKLVSDDPANFTRGWLKVGKATALPDATSDGWPIAEGELFIFHAVLGKDRLAFARDSQTAYDCKLYVAKMEPYADAT